MMSRMGDDPLVRFDRAVVLADGVISAVGVERLGDPTPCREWSVRQVIDHVVAGNAMALGMLTAGRRPRRGREHPGDDPPGAFRESAHRLRGALSQPGVVERIHAGSSGAGPGLWILNLRVIELTVHSWDVAKATGQRTDIDPVLADWALRTLRDGLPPDRRGGPFGREQPAPAYLPIAERMAAFAGRRVG
jgi:uncharacterized protein (TIGR03086 family)